MARGINKVILVGNCTKDPEIRYMPSGGAVASFTIATNESWTDKNTGQKQERAEFHNCTAFNRLGEIVGEYLKKGGQCYVEGSIRTEKYQDKDTGQDRYSTKIIARELQLLGSKSDGSAQGGSLPANAGRQQASNAPPVQNDFDDDIPF